ncbi:Aerotaxis receptor [Thalassovita gelatinovora]|uniref:Aerotaxis receptor n=1 Tax=Thalassovita gelatinovora TaxID=53501 RepID=A0A0P1G1U8_THAGE|nr:PAS domain-containing protein [Thalassovita gelatinovora]QIZ79706.1 histidine kinase [Thalassovita gelatinovora]CUH66688.1 Aerotaxis receptor [Thalassovita gelatinovora]SEQ40905.1 aerotaxis receptor [Thalassovita gelatinovora]
MNTMTVNDFEAAKNPVQDYARSRTVSEVNVEEPFNVEEIFFSRTDTRGVIEAYNSVFVRVSGCSASELKGAPHKIIRHSHMPKGVFWVLWNGLQHGQSVGAYVKNKSKDGHYYWVFALVTPLEDGGYLSLRIKPTSPQLKLVEELYKDICKLEQEQNLSPEESAKVIAQRLADLGFPTYGAFQAHALHQEFEARRIAIGLPPFPDLTQSETLAVTSEKLRQELNNLTAEFQNAEILTANMKIFAAKLVVGRATINEIAKNYDLMLKDIQNHLKTLAVPPVDRGLWDAPKELSAYFMICASHLVTEMCEFFDSEKHHSEGVDWEAEKHLLDQLRRSYDLKSEKAIEFGLQSAMAIQRRTDFLQRMVLGLSTVRIACRVEAGMLRDHAKGLETIVSRLDQFHDEIEAHLEKIKLYVATILHSVEHPD